MTSQLHGVIGRLRTGKPLHEAAVNEIERLLEVLSNEGWSGFIPADEAAKALVEADDLRRADEDADSEALDKLNLLLSAKDWPGPSGLEDVCAIVRATGREAVKNAPAWEKH